MRNYSYRRTVYMVLLITIVLVYCSIYVFLVLLWEISFGLRHFLLAWDISFFFCRETLSFAVRLFLSPWDFFFWCDTFSFLVRMFLLKISGQPNKKDLAGYVAYAYCCEQRSRKGRCLESIKALVGCVVYD